MPTPAERAGVLSGFASAIISLYQAGLISRPSAREELKAMGKELGAFSNLELPENPAQQIQPMPESNSVIISPDAR